MSFRNPFELSQTYWIDAFVFLILNETKSEQTLHDMERILRVKNYHLHWRRKRELACDGIYYFALWSDNILTNIFKMFSFFARRLFVTCKGAKGDEHSFLTCSSRIFFEWKLFCTWTIAVQLFPFWWTICILRLLLEIPAKTFCFKAEIVLCSLFSCSCFRRSPWEFRLF